MAVHRDVAEIHVQVTSMRRRHLRGVLRIEQAVYPRPWSASLFLGELALRSTRDYLVARVGRRVVGYGGIMLVGGDAHVTTLAVDPETRRRGVGTRLLVGLARRARHRDADAMTLEVRASNHVAQALYRRFEFEAVGMRIGYYADNGEDAVVMWAREIRSPRYAELLDRHAALVPGTTTFEGGT